jgi:hypothetical protein
LFAIIPKLGNGGPVSRKEFVDKYLNCERLSPKWVKVLRDITLEEINKFFGHVVNKNSYSYELTKDPIFIEKVERLWMVVHPKACVLASKLISLGMAQGLTCERLGKPLNWAMYVKWTNIK